MTTQTNLTLDISEDHSLILLRNTITERTQALGFSALEQTKLVTAASELARNTLLYAQAGQVHLEQLDNNGRPGLQLTFEDQGPGIEDLDQALTDGFSTGTGLGMGLPGAKRLVNEFEIESQPGKGTKIKIILWKHGR